jgi:Uncharacterized protein conserved in bacteria (DUF2213)
MSKRAVGYFASHISDNLLETPEGYLIAPGCVIARTGFQTYDVRDLPQEAARDLGVDVSDPMAKIDLYRPPEEVFHPETIASAEGKPVTDQHPPDFVDPHNFSEYARGHIQNVRKGVEPLDSGDWPLLADVVITAEPLLSKVKNGVQRDISLGYDYSIRRDGEKICQCDMVINHNAIVPKGRAGPEARINDAAPEPGPEISDSPQQPGAAPQRASPPPPKEARQDAGQPINVTAALAAAPAPKKENLTMSDWTKRLFGRGFRALATDAAVTDEDLAEAAKAVGANAPPDKDVEDAARGKDRAAKDKKGKDADPAIAADPDYDHEAGIPGEDRRGAHDALDRMLDRRAKDKRKGKDADIAALRDLIDDYLAEEEVEPEHGAADKRSRDRHVDDDPDLIEEPDTKELDAALAGAPEADDEAGEPGEVVVESGEEELEPEAAAEDGVECAHCGAAYDAGEEGCPECGCRDRKADDRRPVRDRARAADGVAAALKLMRPSVARCNDAGVKKAFNTALASLTKASRASSGSYGAFARAARATDEKKTGPRPAGARARAADERGGSKGKDPGAELQAAYDAALKGGK